MTGLPGIDRKRPAGHRAALDIPARWSQNGSLDVFGVQYNVPLPDLHRIEYPIGTFAGGTLARAETSKVQYDRMFAPSLRRTVRLPVE